MSMDKDARVRDSTDKEVESLNKAASLIDEDEALLNKAVKAVKDSK